MQFPDLPDTWEEETITQQPKKEVEFTVKPTGELTFKGEPSSDIVRQIITSTDYHRDQDRRYQSEIEQRVSDETRMVNLMTIGFLGTAFLVCILCGFLSFNSKSNNQGNINYDGQFVRGACR